MATLPFLDKAVHIDDVLYLRVADQILRTPMDPYRGEVLWDARDGEPAKLFLTDFNPPLWKYVLAAGIAIAGRAEWKLHLLESACVFATAFALLRLSRRYTRWPIWCVAMVLWGPFFLPGQNLMLEAPMLALSLWGVDFLLQGIETDSQAKSMMAGFLLGLALLVKYTAGLLLPILLLLVLLNAMGKPRLWRHGVFFVVPMLMLFGWIEHNRHFYGTSHFGAHGYATGVGDALTRFRAVVRTVGAVSVFCLPMLWLTWRSRFGGWATGGSLLFAGMWASFDWHLVNEFTTTQGWSPSPIEKAHFIAFAGTGAFTCMALASLGIQRLASRQFDVNGISRVIFGWLAAWCCLVLVFNVVSVPFVAPRHLLLFFVPAVWLISNLWDELDPAGGWRYFTLAVSSLLGFVLAAADFEVAGHYRKLAKSEVARHAAAGNRTVWFTGSWGFAYYATQSGGFPIVSEPAKFGLPAFNSGDLVVHPALLNWGDLYGFAKKTPSLQEVDHLQNPDYNPVRTLGPNINYYAVQGHSLPWCFFVRPIGEFPYVEIPPIDDTLIYTITSTRRSSD